ncbi:MAG: hypothetical protein EHM77_03495, partial [Planctomycetaceae bacterium]
MERRLLSWFVASTLFLAIYMTLNVMFAPPPAPKPVVDAVPGAAADAVADGGKLAAAGEAPPAAVA